MVHNIFTNWENYIISIHFIGYNMANLTYKNWLNWSILTVIYKIPNIYQDYEHPF